MERRAIRVEPYSSYLERTPPRGRSLPVTVAGGFVFVSRIAALRSSERRSDPAAGPSGSRPISSWNR